MGDICWRFTPSLRRFSRPLVFGMSLLWCSLLVSQQPLIAKYHGFLAHWPQHCPIIVGVCGRWDSWTVQRSSHDKTTIWSSHSICLFTAWATQYQWYTEVAPFHLHHCNRGSLVTPGLSHWCAETPTCHAYMIKMSYSLNSWGADISLPRLCSLRSLGTFHLWLNCHISVFNITGRRCYPQESRSFAGYSYQYHSSWHHLARLIYTVIVYYILILASRTVVCVYVCWGLPYWQMTSLPMRMSVALLVGDYILWVPPSCGYTSYPVAEAGGVLACLPMCFTAVLRFCPGGYNTDLISRSNDLALVGD